jgi:hypothetical protein
MCDRVLLLCASCRYHLQENPVEADGRPSYRPTGKAIPQQELQQQIKQKQKEGGRKAGGGKKGEEPLVEPHYLELKWRPELHLATRDCTCDFWDRIG